MTMTDPVADLLTRLRNANSAYHDTVSLPSSKLKSHLAEILKNEGYISAWKVEDARVGQTLTGDLETAPIVGRQGFGDPRDRAGERRRVGQPYGRDRVALLVDQLLPR